MEDTSESTESGSLLRCWRCGEEFEPSNDLAELARVDLSGQYKEGSSVIVHAEPCGVEMLRDGWAQA